MWWRRNPQLDRIETKIDHLTDAVAALLMSNSDNIKLGQAGQELKRKTDALKAALASAPKSR